MHIHAETNCSFVSQTLQMPATVTVDDNAAVGTLIGTWNPTTMEIDCWKDTYYEWDAYHRLYTSLPLQGGITVTDGGVMYNVYQTSVPGVGIAIGFQNVDRGNAWETVTTQAAYTSQASTTNQIRGPIIMIANTSGGNYNTTAQFKVAFVKTGEVRTSFSTNMVIVNYYPVWYGKQYSTSPPTYGTTNLQYSQINISPVQFKVTPPSCTVSTDTANLSVNLPTATISNFSAAGSTAKPTPFNIYLQNCYKLPQVTMTMAAMADTDYPNAAAQGAIKNTGGSATGVAVQVLSNKTGTPAVFPLNTATVVGTVGGTGRTDTFTLPMVARYIQTKPSMTAGLVNATAILTFTYQ